MVPRPGEQAVGDEVSVIHGPDSVRHVVELRDERLQLQARRPDHDVEMVVVVRGWRHEQAAELGRAPVATQ